MAAKLAIDDAVHKLEESSFPGCIVRVLENDNASPAYTRCLCEDYIGIGNMMQYGNQKDDAE